jgi:glycosyltransferase involved in cell wall biosynthesis
LSPPRRILHVVTVLSVGGVETWLLALLRENNARRQRGEDHLEIDILMTGGRFGTLDEMARELGATLHYITFSRKSLGRFARKFRRLLNDRSYSVIHDHQDYSAGLHFLAGAGALPSVRIVHVHNPPRSLRANTDTRARRFFFGISQRAVRRMATHVLGTSAQLLREYGFTGDRFPRQKIRALHCGFDVNEFAASHEAANSSVCEELGWPIGSKICFFAGRLDGIDPNDPLWNHKNPEFALEVVRHSISGGADLRFIMAGDGESMRVKLIDRVKSWGMEDRIVLPGKRLDIARLMAASHVCLFPSVEEGLGMVAVEAQAAGVRVMASDTVPREAGVIDGLITFLPLSLGTEKWAEELSRQIVLPRTDSSAAANKVGRSDFSIDRSYDNLATIYSGRA